MRTPWMLLAITALGCASSRTASPSIDLVGSWHDCATTLTFAEGGTVSLVDHRQGCTADGAYTIAANVLDIDWTDDTCVRDAHWSREVVVPTGGIVMVDPMTATTSRWADDATPRARYRFDSTEPLRSSIVRIVGTPGVGVGTGCYWSTDGECGGFFSCSGSILGWSSEDDTLHGTTGCSGECPCGAVLDATSSADGIYEASYRGASCEASLEGSFTITQLDD